MFTTENLPSLNSIVRGARCGVFVVLGFKTIGGEFHVALKEVNPANHAETGRGELYFTLAGIRPY